MTSLGINELRNQKVVMQHVTYGNINPSHLMEGNYPIKCNCATDLPTLFQEGVSHLVNIGSGNGLTPIQCPAITRTDDDSLSIGSLGTKFIEISIKMQWFMIKKMHLRQLSAKWQSLWFSLHAITHLSLDKMAAISQTPFSHVFSWMKSLAFWFKFHWSLFLRVKLTISQNWFR